MDISYSLDNIQSAAKQFLEYTAGHTIFAFHGDLGSGKTTFIKELCAAFLVTNVVSSPTYSIINEYGTPDGKTIYHMDLYRVKNESEAMDAGVEECFLSGNTCFVEWPENAPLILPPEAVHCTFTREAGIVRKLQIKL